MNYKIVSLSVLLLLGTTGVAQAETQILDLQQTADASKGGCGDYTLESVSLSPIAGASEAMGAISITNEAGQQLAGQKLDAGQAGKLSVTLRPVGDDEVEDLAVQVITRDADGNIKVVETAEANAQGTAEFKTALADGTYQVAVSCGALAAAGLASGTAGLAALGTAGVTAIAVGASVNSGSSGSNNADAANSGLNPRVNDDVPAPVSLQGASQSGDFQ